MENTEYDFLKPEYTKLSAEIGKLSEEIRTRERFATAFSPLAGAWIFINFFKDKGYQDDDKFYLSMIICLFTFLIVLLYGISVWLIYKNILITGTYLKKIEDRISAEIPGSTFGWEKFYADAQNKSKYLVVFAKASWILYLVIPIIMAIVIKLLHG